jgi:hypothetical protein
MQKRRKHSSQLFRLSSEKRSAADQRGVFLIMLGIGMVVLLAALAFAIDIPQKEVVSQELRLAIDSAALGGSQQLNGTPLGMYNAVTVIEDTIKKNLVAGKVLTDERYSIEFGFYSFPDKNFRSLGLGSKYRNDAALPRETYNDIPIPALVNAVRVAAKVTAPSVFSGVFGLLNMGEVSGTSVATANANPKVCAFPMAIPLCSLFLNQNSNLDLTQSENWVTPELDGNMQCQRPVFITNANYSYEVASPDFRSDRLGGLIRASEYPRKPRIAFESGNACRVAAGTTGPNCISEPILGTFVMPKSRDVDGDGQVEGDGDVVATMDEYGAFLEKVLQHPDPAGSGYCIDFELGESLAPLDDSVMARVVNESIVSPTVETAFARLFALAAAVKFTSVFKDPRSVAVEELPKNYPFLRDTPRDRIEGFGDVRTLSPKMGAWQWTNPLCHATGQPANDPENARVVPLVVPVIMPAQDLIETKNWSYCNPGAQVGNRATIDGFSPQSETRPQVVGFIEINLIDYNFRWLENEGPTDTNTSGGLLR